MNIIAEDRVLEIVCRELARIRREHGGDANHEIRPDSSLVADVGFDSLSMVEALVAVEQALGIDELSLVAWTDEELEREGPRFTVASLVDVCRRRLSTRPLQS